MEDTEVVMEGGVQKYVDRYWGEVMKVTTVTGQMWFHILVHVMVAVFSLPYTNTGCERAFSLFGTCTQSINAYTLTALLQCKLNKDR